MITYSDKTKTYIGRGAGKELEEELKKAKKSIKIVSPYLSPSYVEDLLEFARKGISITLITSNEIEKDKSGNYSTLSDTDLIKQKRMTDEKAKKTRKKGMIYSGIGVAISLTFFFINIVLAVISLLVSIIFFSIFYKKGIYSYTYYSPIRLRVIPDKYHDREKGKYLIHSKIFIIDNNIAFVGSVNYTYSGFKKSYETITKIKTEKAVRDISTEVERLFYDKSVYSKSIEEWGKELYLEPSY